MSSVPQRPNDPRAFLIFNVGMLAQMLIMVAVTRGYAWLYGKMLDSASIERYGRIGAGPWDHVATMSTLIDFIFLSAAVTVIAGGVNFATTSSVRRRVFAAVSVLTALVVIRSHLWLLD